MDEKIKKMRALMLDIDAHIKKAAELMNSEDKDKADKAAAEMDAAAELQKQVDVLQRIIDAEKAHVPVPDEKDEPGKVDGFEVMAKLLRGRSLTKAEMDAITIDEKSAQQLVTGDNALNGENYLCPEDVDVKIRELRKTYTQARDYITVEPTSYLSGRFPIEAGSTSGLVEFDDGDDLDDNSAPSFGNKTWAIKWYGAFIPVSQILESAERASLISYLNRWFVKRAVITENIKIFATLKAGYNSGTPKAITGADGLRSSINKDLDPSCQKNGFILTNQSGFDCLDKELDGEGRHVLQPDYTEPGTFRFRGMKVVPFTDGELANIDSTHFPVIYGDTKAAAVMKLYKSLLLANSPHANFKKAQTLFRVIEGFDVVSADTTAVIYGSLTASE